ncbi:MAG: hypothetical protein ABL876_18570 [Chitinophagaceae bacterium]
MTAPILFIYGLGLAFFILGCEGMGETDRSMTNIIYLALAFFLNMIGYYVSYSSTDYVSLAYIPLSLLAITTIILIYTAWQMIPVSQSWDDQTEEGEF